MKIKNDKLKALLIGLCMISACKAAVNFNVEQNDDKARQDKKKANTVKYDSPVRQDTLFVLNSMPDMLGTGYNIVFVDKNGRRQMVCGMIDNVTVVDSGDVVVVDEYCRIVKLLERGKRSDEKVR